MIAGVLLILFSLQGLAEQWTRIAEEARGRVGAAALVIESGESTAMNGSGHFPMQSVYKLPISMAVLRKVDEGKLSLDQTIDIRPDQYVPRKYNPLRDQFPTGTRKTVRELIHYALVESDGTASDVLLGLAGGPQAVTEYIRSLGITDLVVANSEMDMNWKTQYDDWCTPDAAIKLLVALHRGNALSAASRALVLADMQETQTGANRIRRLLPRGTPVADKTGTSWTQDGQTAATNDIGVVTLPDGRHLALAIFVSDAAAPEAVREGVIARIARAAWERWATAK